MASTPSDRPSAVVVPEHTEGPWTYFAGTRSIHKIIDTNGSSVAVAIVCGPRSDKPRDPRIDANAHLISAAPEMLIALRHMELCRTCGEESWDTCEGGRAALAAIAKAEGR